MVSTPQCECPKWDVWMPNAYGEQSPICISLPGTGFPRTHHPLSLSLWPSYVSFPPHPSTPLQHLYDLRNYNGVMEVMSGLNSTPVRKLQSTWRRISADDAATLRHLEGLMSSSGNFAEYRRSLAACGPSTPCIPHFGLYLTDITFVDDGNPDLLPSGLINMPKRRKLMAIMREMARFQKIDYCFTMLPSFVEFITEKLTVVNEDERYALAARIVEQERAGGATS